MSTGAAVAQSDAAVREALARVLADRAYDGRRMDPEAWLGALDRVSAWLESLARWFEQLAAVSPTLFVLFVAGLVLVALGLLLHVGLSVRAAFRADAGGAPPARRGPAARDFLSEAEALAADGRFLDASRRVHLACLDLLLRRRWIELHKDETHRALRRALLDAPLPEPERRRFGALLGALERELFRDGGDDPELYRGWLAMHAALARVAA